MSVPKLAALVVLSASALMTILDGSIVTVAMPAIQRDLGFSAAQLSWTVNAYLIAFGGLLLLAGRAGDLIGRRTVFVTGNVVFTAASVLAGLATSPAWLVAARFLQGVGSALASAVVLGILVTVFTETRERATAIGVFSSTGAAGASIGQVLGGILTDTLSWHWIFFINVPIGALTVAAAVRVLPADRGMGWRAGADVLGAVLVTAGLMLGIYTVVGIADHGWVSGRTLGLAAVSVALLAGFVARQARARTPLLPLRIFRSRTVVGANLIQMLALSGMFGFQILVALFMQRVLGYGATATGLAMLPAAVSIGGVSLLLSARLNTRFGARTVLIAGLVLLVAAMALLTRLPVHAGYLTDLLPTMVLIAGGGLVLPALATLGMSAAGEADAGLAGGLFNTTQQIGMALGVAVLSTLAASRTAGALAHDATGPEALTSGYRLAFAVSTGLLAAALVATVTILRRRGTISATEAEHRSDREPALEPGAGRRAEPESGLAVR
ncbi:MFS transporter [Nocardia sp. alder85J]|uniref:MFS transporter n=1 Tax=Nocardia sp. alder85J TaxID=2862949 RepID=UPI001CD62677|nr:MFS transporter [Nocardia sp. alder85J]MCX4095428.1 MFS transporter [Nocardia sp. alder85J]